jgi:hypothetical protein
MHGFDLIRTPNKENAPEDTRFHNIGKPNFISNFHMISVERLFAAQYSTNNL